MEQVLFLLKSILMGVVEGVTEFLPISSTGHMILVGSLIQFNDKFANLFEVVIQLGAILAIVVLYRQKIFHSFKTLHRGGFGYKLWSGILLGTIPALLIGALDKVVIKKVLHRDIISDVMMKPLPVSLALIGGALWILYAEKRYRKSENTAHIERVSLRQAFAIGLFQCIAMVWPGFSRSAATIIGGWVVGLATPTAAEFSFFLAIPAMFAATGGDLVSTHMALTGMQIVSLLIGFVTAFVVALFVVRGFVEYLKRKPMKVFAAYRLVIGALFLVLSLANIVKVSA